MIGGHVVRGDGIGCIVVGCVVPVPKIPKIIGLTQKPIFFRLGLVGRADAPLVIA